MNRRQLLQRSAAIGTVGLTFQDVLDLISAHNNGEATFQEVLDLIDEFNTQERLKPEEPVHHSDEFGTVIDAVKAGADPEGNDPIDGILNQYAADDTLLSFPAGTYLLPQTNLTGYDHLGIAAAHDEHPTFVAPAGSCNGDPHIQFTMVSDFLLEGVDFDFQRQGAGGAINVIASGDATVRDVTAQGSCRQPISMLRIDIRDRSNFQ